MERKEPTNVQGSSVSRRDFLRTTGLGAAAFALPGRDFPAVAEGKTSHENSGAGGGYEYAAGEVLLPFSYSVTPSPQPKPVCLDFSHQINPDNCQVFVRMEGELYEFRSQWIINLGTTARYKGPDIDHMTRIEDA